MARPSPDKGRSPGEVVLWREWWVKMLLLRLRILSLLGRCSRWMSPAVEVMVAVSEGLLLQCILLLFNGLE